MKKKRFFLIIVNFALLIVVFVLSIKIIDYSSLSNWLATKLTGQPVCKDCNVILISLDTFGSNHLPCYGYKRNTAPNLCNFAKENILFKNMYSNATYTLPSHVSLFTSLYPSQHKVNTTYRDVLDKKIPFLPEIFQKNRYETLFYMPLNNEHLPIDTVYNRGISSINHASSPPDWIRGINILKNNTLQGKKTFLFLLSTSLHSPQLFNNSEKKVFGKNGKTFSNIPQSHQDFISTKYSEKYFEFMYKRLLGDSQTEYWGSRQNELKGFLKQLQSLNSEADRIKFLKNPDNDTLTNEYLYAFYIQNINKYNKDEIQYLVDLHDSKIHEIDELLGSVFAQIKAKGLQNNTVIIVTSSHGDEIFEHGEYGHGNNLYNTNLKIPLIVSVPGYQHVIINNITQTIDIFPSLLKILNIPNSSVISGQNFFSPPTGKTIKSELISSDYYQGAIQNLDWKIHFKFQGNKVTPEEIYNTKKDPLETKNLIFINNTTIERLLKNIHK